MRILESSSNPRIQKVKKTLSRKNPDEFVIEGSKLFEEALQSGMQFEEAYFTEEAAARYPDIVRNLQTRDVSLNRISARIAKQISDVETPPGLIAILKKPEYGPVAIRNAALLLIGLRDPGNFGAIVRTAEGAGMDAVFYTADCADPFQPKAVRGSMGSLFRVPVIEIADPAVFLKEQTMAQVKICGLVPEGGVQLHQWKPSMPLLLCVGSESHGIPPELSIPEKLSIPMEGKTDSLNAAVAASICLYWIHLTCRNRN